MRPLPDRARALSLAVVFCLVSSSVLVAQVPQEAGAPPSDISNIPKPVISTVDSINMRDGLNDSRTKPKAAKKADTCLLPPLNLLSDAMVAANQLQTPAKAKKHYEDACGAIRKLKTVEAEKHLRLAIQEYMQYSIAWVTLGQILARQNRIEEARQVCFQASLEEPKYVAPYLCLADLAAHANDWNEVLLQSERGLDSGPTQDAITYEYHAAANLHLHNLTAAEKSALRAIELDRDHHEPRANFVLAQIYEAKGDRENEARQLREYLKYADNPQDIAAVKNALLQLEARADQKPVPDLNTKKRTADEATAGNSSWAPPDIDASVPPVDASVACSLPTILKETSQRTQDFIENLQRFSAEEHIQQTDVDKHGQSKNGVSQVVSYVAEVRNSAAGYPAIREYRSGSRAQHESTVIDTGSATFALIFHPSHIGSFEFRCEGISRQFDEKAPAWQLHFEEKDPTHSFQAIRVGGALYLPRLKGRAWITAKTYEVQRIETDLVSPLAEIDFELEHLVINYAPAEFKNHSIRMWLPESTSLYIAYRRHRYQRTHSFTHFQLFSVDSQEAVKEPAAPPKDRESQLIPLRLKLFENEHTPQ
jgi:tetratricopeptide (TPR) repeat protein